MRAFRLRQVVEMLAPEGSQAMEVTAPQTQQLTGDSSSRESRNSRIRFPHTEISIRTAFLSLVLAEPYAGSIARFLCQV
ncbi:hypothetical protein FGO68_gene14636 [Halteria grandinella]|uniref:Uncharacterized protein n=1 Tax=Halteria grandinella TaxID=5974 RepID=A0A8J8NI36_HALGN|nr:hypothetical protein FGO68_gene14636 [Halteria grandinella]